MDFPAFYFFQTSDDLTMVKTGQHLRIYLKTDRPGKL